MADAGPDPKRRCGVLREPRLPHLGLRRRDRRPCASALPTSPRMGASTSSVALTTPPRRGQTPTSRSRPQSRSRSIPTPAAWGSPVVGYAWEYGNSQTAYSEADVVYLSASGHLIGFSCVTGTTIWSWEDLTERPTGSGSGLPVPPASLNSSLSAYTYSSTSVQLKSVLFLDSLANIHQLTLESGASALDVRQFNQ